MDINLSPAPCTDDDPCDWCGFRMSLAQAAPRLMMMRPLRFSPHQGIAFLAVLGRLDITQTLQEEVVLLPERRCGYL